MIPEKKPSLFAVGEKVLLKPFQEEYISDNYLKWLKDTSLNKYVWASSGDITLEDIRIYCRTMDLSPDNFFLQYLIKTRIVTLAMFA